MIRRPEVLTSSALSTAIGLPFAYTMSWWTTCAGERKSPEPDLPAEMIAASVGPVKSRLLVLEHVAGHLGVVVAPERDLGDVAASRIGAEEAPVPFRDGTAPDHGDDAIRLDAEDDRPAVLVHGKLAGRARRVARDLALVRHLKRLAAREIDHRKVVVLVAMQIAVVALANAVAKIEEAAVAGREHHLRPVRVRERLPSGDGSVAPSRV